MILSWVTVLFCFASVVNALPTHGENSALWYLQKFSHLEKTVPGALTGYKSVSSIREFEKFAGLKETGSKRPVSGLTYRIKKFPIQVKEVGQEIAQAFQVWSDVTGLWLKEDDVGQMDISISFDRTEHGDEKSSGHSFFPRYGDTAEEEKQERNQKTELNHAPDLCQDASLDTITRTNDGSTYAFKGEFYWKINYNVTADGYPRRIADDWDGLEGNLDASFTRLDGKTFFFKGRHYWSFTDKRMDSGYPKRISVGFRGIPDDLDAAVTWGGNGKPYFFKGGQYMGENPPVKKAYPMSIREWKGLPLDGIDAAILWENNASYFFKGGHYDRFDDVTSEVSKQFNYPLSIATEWFSCEHKR